MMLKSKNLRYSYGPKVSFHFPDIECPAGETVLITGSSGKGKTTLLHLLAGILPLLSGEICIDQTNVTKLGGRELDRFRGNKIGIVFQQSHFVQSLTVLENLLLAGYLAGRRPDRSRALHLLEQLNLDERSGERIFRLSQGQQQRVSIARAVMNYPSVILADEPTSNLDDEHCIEVAALLKQQSETTGAALVIVTHDQRLKDIFLRKIELV